MAQTKPVLALKAVLGLALVAVVAVTAWNLLDFPASTSTPVRVAVVPPLLADMELDAATVVSAVEDPKSAGRQRLVAEEAPVDVSAVAGMTVLRVVLEGITEAEARMTTVTLTGVDKRAKWPGEIQDSWTCQGLTSEFDLDPFFATVAEQSGDLRDQLVVAVDHPLHLTKKTRVPLSGGVVQSSGQTVYEVAVRLIRPVFWPEITLAVRDADTRAHLKDVELRCVPTSFMAAQLPAGGVYTSLGDGLSSPIALLGAREADGRPDWVAGMALGPAAGEAPQPADLAQAVATGRGVLVYARAPGYAWRTIVLDVSTGAENELLLVPAVALSVRLMNVQLERYAALGRSATLLVVRPRPGGEEMRVLFQELDETLETEGLRIDALEPGEYVLSVELGYSWQKRPVVLAREELSFAAGEQRELVLALADPPTSPARATLGGVVSFPAVGGVEGVRLQFYEAATYLQGDADVVLSLADLERVGGALPTWSFRVEDLPLGLYQVELRPFMTSWMIELPAGGREDLELVIPELAEVLVETVDAETGERIPLDVIGYGSREDLPGQVTNPSKSQGTRAEFEDEPGRFRFWTAPGAAFVQAHDIPSGLDYGVRRQELELVPGLQEVRIELTPVNAIRFEFRVDGAILPRDDAVYHFQLSFGIRAVDHEGHVSAILLQPDRLVEVSEPGVYEVSFEGVGADNYSLEGPGADRFQPVPPRLVNVRPGETAEVIVELLRK